MKENAEYATRIIPLLHRNHSIDSFKGGEKAKETCGIFVNNYEPLNGQHLLFTGKTGVGKTHLAVSIYKELITQNKIESENVKFVTAPELLLEIKKTFNGASVMTESDVIDKYSNADLLILDDLGSEKATEFAIQSLYLVIDRRIRNMKPIVITTNLSLKEIEEKLDARIASRLASMKVVEISMPDYRKKRGR